MSDFFVNDRVLVHDICNSHISMVTVVLKKISMCTRCPKKTILLYLKKRHNCTTANCGLKYITTKVETHFNLLVESVEKNVI